MSFLAFAFQPTDFNICLEDKSIELPDGATMILLSTKGTLDDVPPDVKAFLNYIDEIPSKDEFVMEIDQEIRNLKEIEAERVSYMTFAMKIQEERDEANEEGRKEGKESTLDSVIVEMLRANQPISLIRQVTKCLDERIEAVAAKNGMTIG